MVSPERAETPSEAQPSRPGFLANAWCLVAFSSGTAALLFETLWFRVAGLSLGNGVWASSVVLSAFMAGLAIGNGLAARRADRSARPARLYALLELTIGLSGVTLVVGLPLLTPWLAPALAGLRDTPWLLNAVRLLIALLAMMTPAIAMGATLPVLVKSLSRHDPRFGRVLGRLYGWNTLGAVVGALAVETVLLEALGMRGSALVALAVNALSALGALALAGAGTRAGEVATTPAPRIPIPAPIRGVLFAAFLSGAAFLALEVVWFRFLALFVYGTSLVFAVLLAVVLVGIALGGLSAARWLRAGPQAAARVPSLALLSAFTALLGYIGFETVLAAFLPPGTAAAEAWHVALLAIPLMLPTAWVSGVLFTFMGETIRRTLGADARSAGLLTLSNTLGGAVGSLAGGFLLLPQLGIEKSLLLLAGAYLVVAALSLPAADATREGGTSPWPTRAALATLVAVSWLIFPSGALRSHHLVHPTLTFQEPGARVIAVREGLLQTIVLVRTERFAQPLYHRLFTDGFSMSATTSHSRRYMKAYVYLPVALNPEMTDALLISYGVGSTAKSLTDTASLERIDVVDISPDVLGTSALIYPRRADDPLEDPRVEVHVEDGRFYLQTVDRKYDLITSEPPPPKYAGVVSLYSREYFELIRDRLRDGGITTYWLPVHNLSESDALAITRAFCDVFADCTLWTGAGLDWMLVGTRDRTTPTTAEEFRRQWQDPVVEPELSAVGFETPESLGATFMAGRETLARWTDGVEPVIDDFPLRISHEPVQPSLSQQSDFFRRALETGATRREFEGSDFIARLWPAELRESTLSAFRWQRVFNGRLVYDSTTSNDTADLHEVLRDTSLRTLPLWLLGSSLDEQRVLAGIPTESTGYPGSARHRGVGALAERDYTAAAQWFARARIEAPDDARVASLEIYALCMAGSLDEALEAARTLVATHPDAARSDEHWQWMTETFGLPDPRQGQGGGVR